MIKIMVYWFKRWLVLYRKVVGSKKNMGKYNYENLKDDAEVVKNWEPLKFEISDNYKYI